MAELTDEELAVLCEEDPLGSLLTYRKGLAVELEG